MIERIHIKNFQAHKDRTLEFAPGVTTIVGPNDCGKSTILRAIRWVVLNRPSGNSIIRNGAKFAWGELIVDGHNIVRKKGEGHNSYFLNDSKLPDIGREVPDEIERIVNLSPLNFQMQGEPPFWFNLNAGQLAKELNVIVNLTDIDDAIAFVSSGLRKTKAEVEVVEDRKRKASEKAESLAWTVEAHEQIIMLQEDEKTLQAKQGMIGRLETLVLASQSIGDERKRLQATVELLSPLVDLGANLIVKQKNMTKLTELVSNADRSEVILKAFKKLPDISGLASDVEALTAKETGIKKLEELVERVEEWELEACQAKARRKDSEARLKEVANCPLCGNPLNMSKRS